MWKCGIVVSIVIAACGGCTARLSVNKVTPDDHGDKIKGFRYYLSRPYVVVEDKILVSETIRLCEAKKSSKQINPIEIKPLVLGPGGKVAEVSPEEAARLREWTKAGNEVKPVAYATEVQNGSDAQSITSLDASVPSGVGEHVPDPTATPKKLSGTAPLAGKIKIVFLPDFEEQYAVSSKNFLAKNAYALNFRNGWELTDVSSEGDSTTVAIELLNALDKAIGSAKDVAEAGIDRRKAVADEAAKKSATDKDRFGNVTISYYQEIVRIYIKPGVYRLNKPWEMGGGLSTHKGSDFLTNMGLALYQITERQVLPAPEVDITLLGKPKSGEVGK